MDARELGKSRDGKKKKPKPKDEPFDIMKDYWKLGLTKTDSPDGTFTLKCD